MYTFLYVCFVNAYIYIYIYTLFEDDVCLLPSTKDVRRVTVTALRLPAGRFMPIFSSLSRKERPPFLLLARRKTPPRSEALRHSGGFKRRWISPTVTLYLDVELRRLSRPGTEQKRSVESMQPMPLMQSLLSDLALAAKTKQVDGRLYVKIR